MAIKKKCIKYKIPTPPHGYWAKKAAGHKIKIPKFSTDNYNPQIEIYPYIPDKIKEIIVTIKKTIKGKRIPDKLNKPIRFVRDTKKAYKKAYMFADPFLHVPPIQKVLDLKVSANSLSWALIVYDSILKALEKGEYQFYYSSEDRYGGRRFIASKLGVPINLYIYEIRKIKKTEKYSQKYEMTGLLALKISGKFYREAIIYEKKEHGFKNQLAKILNKIEYTVMSTIEDNRLRRMKLLQERKKERLKKIFLSRHKHLKFIKNEEKKRFCALMNDATMHNNCNIVRQYLEAMEYQWRKESCSFTKEQKNKLNPIFPTNFRVLSLN